MLAGGSVMWDSGVHQEAIWDDRLIILPTYLTNHKCIVQFSHPTGFTKVVETNEETVHLYISLK